MPEFKVTVVDSRTVAYFVTADTDVEAKQIVEEYTISAREDAPQEDLGTEFRVDDVTPIDSVDSLRECVQAVATYTEKDPTLRCLHRYFQGRLTGTSMPSLAGVVDETDTPVTTTHANADAYMLAVMAGMY